MLWKPRTYRRSSTFSRLAKLLAFLLVVWTTLETLYVRNALILASTLDAPPLGGERIYIASIHWNNEPILRSHWISAVVALVQEIGAANVFVSVLESGSYDNTKDALSTLEYELTTLQIPHQILMENITHADELAAPPAKQGWIANPSTGAHELRRIPYLANLRNRAMEPFYNLKEQGKTFDKILWLNDVAFTTPQISTLLHTNDGSYAAACSLDFSRAGQVYDTFALRDIEGREQLSQTWPFFRARASRAAIKASQPVPVASCWNGVVAFDAKPFHLSGKDGLKYRGVEDSLAEKHVEGSECCLIHADNGLASREKGVWVNPNVRVGYKPEAFEGVNPGEGRSWVSVWRVMVGSWTNRIGRWSSVSWIKEAVLRGRVKAWENEGFESEWMGAYLKRRRTIGTHLLLRPNFLETWVFAAGPEQQNHLASGTRDIVTYIKPCSRILDLEKPTIVYVRTNDRAEKSSTRFLL
ncbi:unnamed protein product [Zymoseptoria tritici ST99CH_3D1]|uniref:Uncharacterized protein n=1 Tax=Zymoseptoria tritici ST99CH_1E4 TaxID=1276532 RepID=A0A2H1FZ39_ZYMTR|nr:unnamed protein product [Zymoseptoria tritici ST99CH_1E4]SMR47833.1 unnamed protein product [Zymoseptoria tritici ST99CH_3D1]